MLMTQCISVNTFPTGGLINFKASFKALKKKASTWTIQVNDCGRYNRMERRRPLDKQMIILQSATYTE